MVLAPRPFLGNPPFVFGKVETGSPPRGLGGSPTAQVALGGAKHPQLFQLGGPGLPEPPLGASRPALLGEETEPIKTFMSIL